MSKQSEAKAAQNYQAKPQRPVCMNCAYFRSDITEFKNVYGNTYTEEKNLRCSIGDFAVGRTATCDKFEGRTHE